jgi:hypothetical protein
MTELRGCCDVAETDARLTIERIEVIEIRDVGQT